MAGHSNGRVVPAAFPPPVDSQKEFIKREIDGEDEVIEVGVAIVGGGTAGLACANRLLQLLADDPETMDVSDFLAFKDAVAAATEADFATTMAQYVDFDQLARYIVVDRAIANFDGIMAFYYGPGWGPFNQNYYWYDVGDGQFMLIPWDMDKTFWYPEPNFWTENAPNGGNVPNWNVVTSDCEGYESGFNAVITSAGVVIQGSYWVREIDCDPFLRLLRGEIYDRQADIAAEFIEGPFSEASVSAKLEAWRTQIADAIEEDPLVDSAAWQSAVDDLLADLPKLQDNLTLMMSELITE